jgi:hypothetical protein
MAAIQSQSAGILEGQSSAVGGPDVVEISRKSVVWITGRAAKVLAKQNGGGTVTFGHRRQSTPLFAANPLFRAVCVRELLLQQTLNLQFLFFPEKNHP